MASRPQRRERVSEKSVTSSAYAACREGTAAESLRRSCCEIHEWSDDWTAAAEVVWPPIGRLSMRTKWAIQPWSRAIQGGAAGHSVKPITAMNETATIVAAKR